MNGILAQDVGFVWGGVLRVGSWFSWRRDLSTIGRGLAGVFKAPPGTPVPSALDSPSLLMTAGRPPRGSLDPDKDDRCSWEVERIDPGRIPLALIRSGSGQVGHGPWE